MISYGIFNLLICLLQADEARAFAYYSCNLPPSISHRYQDKGVITKHSRHGSYVGLHTAPPLALSLTTRCQLQHRLQHRRYTPLILLSKAIDNDDDTAAISTSAQYSPEIPYEILPLSQVSKILLKHKTPRAGLTSIDQHIQLGLSTTHATELLNEVGTNALVPPTKKSIWEIWLEQFDDTLVKILVVVAFISASFSISEVWDLIVENIQEANGAYIANDGIVDGSGGGRGGIMNDIMQAYNIIKSNSELKSTIVQSIVEPSIIIAILLLNSIVGVWQDLSARSSLEALEKLQPRLATVLRYNDDNDGNDVDENGDVAKNAEWITEYDATQLVPGDIIKLRVGDSIPADARLVSLTSSTMYVDESSLTGESVSADKLPGDEGLSGDQLKNGNINEDADNTSTSIPIQDQSSMLFSGCLVTRGSGIAMIVRTGPATQIGKIQSTLNEAQNEEEERKTPLGEQLDEFGTTLSYVIGGICVAVWVASIPHFTDSVFDTWAEGAVYYAKVGVALGVAAIPEGLPAVITLCLSLGTRRMAERNVIVRKLPSVETLGCTSVICTDKTGTLTSNQMTAVTFTTLDIDEDKAVKIVEQEVTGSSYNPQGSVVGYGRDEAILNPSGSMVDACDIMVLCNDSRLIGSDSIVDDSDKAPVAQYTIEGEPTEAALLCLVEKLGPEDNSEPDSTTPASTLASQNYNYFANRWDRYATLEFDRRRKSMGVLITNQGKDLDSVSKLLVKGAPGMLIQRCTHVKLRDGNIIPMSSQIRDQIDDTIGSIGDRALRCIGLALKDGKYLQSNLLKENQEYDEVLQDLDKFADIETGLTWVGMVGIKDPPRAGVLESIDLCKKAGIRVIMITGDAKATAVAIAKDVRIFHNDVSEANNSMKAYEGREFFALPESQQLEELKADNLVICRAEPADKQRLVKMLQSLDEIPAMTGDGVNDAPALQQASIGIAMGISGTEVAKEASDMVLVDDNFSTIVDAIEEGRCIYSNMQAFINFLITCNIGEVIGVFIATLLGFPQLLTPLHLLWVNLVTDGPPATALGFNPPDPDLMSRKPRSASEEILTPALLLRYSIGGLYIGIATVGIYASYFVDHGIALQDLSSWSTCDDPSLCSIYTNLAAPQTLALTTLVTAELLKALCTVSVDCSITKVGPQKNPWLILGVAVPFMLNLAIIYIPVFQNSFGLVALEESDWIHILMWSFPVILIDELQKYIYRYDKVEATIE